ncbi:hypothetical protein GCM10008094_23470 [Aidingimonas halophila]|nr:hypothetical protein GCM10008094_23470 [Aidingimonas halophila]
MIAGNVRQVANLVDEIAGATHQQSSGAEQISQAISQLDQVTQQNAALVEQTATASQSLDDQTDDPSIPVSFCQFKSQVSYACRAYMDIFVATFIF